MDGTNNATVTSYTDHILYNIARWIWLIVGPVVIGMGLVGNIFILLVLRRKSFRSSSASILFRALAIVDLLMLLLSCVPRLVAFALKVNLHELYDITCRVEYITTFFLTDLTSWMLVLVTIERCLAVTRPIAAKRFLTARVTLPTIIVLVVTFLILNVPISGILYLNEEGLCEPIDEYRFVWERLISAINFSIASFIPFVLIASINFVGWITLLTHKKQCKDFISTAGLGPSRHPVDPWKINSITRMLIATDIVFLATTLPIVLFQMIHPYSHYHPDGDLRATLTFYRSTCELILYSNSTLNFYLYCWTGKKFRDELLALMGCARRFNARTQG